jgi:AcrR family transcriptional regulator
MRDVSLRANMTSAAPPPPPPRARTRERPREDTRQRIYDSAMEIFRRDGFEAARVDDVARAAGVSHGTFYFHFATKDEVLIQCLRASEARVAAAIGLVPEGAGLMPVVDAAASAVAHEWESDPRLFPDLAVVALRYLVRGPVTTMATGGRPDAPAPIEPNSLVSAVLATHFQTAADRGELTRLLPARVLSYLYLVNIFAAILSWCADPSARTLEITLLGVTRLFLDGVRGPAV